MAFRNKPQSRLRFAGFGLALVLALVMAWSMRRRAHGQDDAERIPQQTSSLLPKPQLSSASIARRTFQTVFCRNARFGSLKGLVAAGFKRTPEQAGSTGVLLPSADVIVQCNAAPDAVARLDARINGTRLASSILGLYPTLCIGGSKFTQLNCRRHLALQHGCTFEQLGIQPPQFKLDNREDCIALHNTPSISTSPFMLKLSAGQAGHGMRYFKTLANLSQAVGGPTCDEASSALRKGKLAQVYVLPALADGFKFDVRCWLLIASVQPLVLFTSLGLVRVASVPFSEDSHAKLVHVTNALGQAASGHHVKSFKWLDEALKRPGFSQGRFRDETDRAMLYVAQAHFSQPAATEGAATERLAHYQVFGCDFIVDADLKAHLLECNGNSHEQGPDVLWHEMMALVLNLHVEPHRLASSGNDADTAAAAAATRQGVWRTGPGKTAGREFSRGFEFGQWRLLWNDVDKPLVERDACAVS